MKNILANSDSINTFKKNFYIIFKIDINYDNIIIKDVKVGEIDGRLSNKNYIEVH